MLARTTVFGTENGYDAGGTDPLVSTSKTNVTDRFTGGLLSQKGNLLKTPNNGLFTGQNTEFTNSCSEGRQILDIEPLDLGPDRLLKTGSNYTFSRYPEILPVADQPTRSPQLSNSNDTCAFFLCEASTTDFVILCKTRELDRNLVPL
jgi:hypothetical protein